MKKIVLLMTLLISTTVFGENIIIQTADLKVGSLNIVVSGVAGGVAEELLSY